MTDNLSTEEIIALAAERPELVCKWSIYLNEEETNQFASTNGLELEWAQPIRPENLYLAKRNTGYKLLTCKFLGKACVHAVEAAYGYECVKVKE